ncbi:hypothetical protein FOS14_03090 [Skermania sp. ID1734]|uniref:hypothetical protein n=1 Tax=Skermania sp. ID1734 TaxID=2597516 RepID=UPI00117CC6B1|nr:hypothetical protein [Skermania sp. ID1734]TSE01541.1 hypothetical protein FOS14_03090 [Skermania sp. ID1734]
MRFRAFLGAAILGIAVVGVAPAQADPVAPTPVVDMSSCPSGPVLCPIYGVMLDVAEVMVVNTLGLLTYGLCFGPVPPGHGAIIPPVVYNYRPWCPPQPPS